MKEEDEILRKCGTGNPFTVPEGYFDHFTERVMEQLPQKETKPFKELRITTWGRVKPWFYMTAVFAGMLFGIHFMLDFTSSNRSSGAPTHTVKEAVTDQDLEIIVDHSMMDDYSLYKYLTEAD